MASESKGGEQRGLPYDTQCAGCEIPLYKGAENYVRIMDLAGNTTFECDRCGSISAEERAELARVTAASRTEQATGQAKYDESRGFMMSEADMEESIGGAADYVAWGSAAPRTSDAEPAFWPSAPADMAAEIERMRAASSAVASAAAAEWTEKSAVFAAPCDIESWAPEDAHASYLGFSAASVPLRSAAAPRRWLGEAAAAGGAAAEPPAMSSRQARILGGATEQN